MPVLPGITDSPHALEELVRRAAECGATYVSACALRLQAAARERYLPFIQQEFPLLAARYAEVYGKSPHAGKAYREGLSALMARLCERHGINSSDRRSRSPSSRNVEQGPTETVPASPCVQLELAM
jgi:DNA repair photolyase